MNRDNVGRLPVALKPKTPATLSPLAVYLQQIAKYPLLEPEEEYELARKHFDEADVGAAHRLITSNLRLVVKIANNFKRSQSDLLDLIQEGNYGLMQAVKRYNPYKKVKLSSYAVWWIRAYILKYLMDNRGQVKIATTAAQRKLFYNLHKETEKLLREYERVTPKLIAEKLDVPEKDVVEMKGRLAAYDVALDAPLSGDADASLRVDILEDEKERPLDQILAEEEQREAFHQNIEGFKSSLKGRDLDIFNSRIISEEPLTLQEIGNKYGISRERARQLEARIIKNLKAFVLEKGTLDI